MELIETEIKDLLIFQPKIYEDKRGYFFESYRQSFIDDVLGKNSRFIQENESKSSFGVLRGLHFQEGEHQQAKLIRVVHGKILDIAVDLRIGSKSFGKYKEIILSSANKKQFYIPKGFAHGFVTLSKKAIISYKVDNYYSPKHESGLRYDDPTLNINWRLDKEDLIVSEKDLDLPYFK